MTDDTNAGRVIIALTDRRPIRIRLADWPVVSQGSKAYTCDGEVTATCNIYIRQHADGRMIVDGCYTADYAVYKAAELIEKPISDNIGYYIRQTVGRALGRKINSGGSESVLVYPAIDEAVALLPPEDLA